jgi:hypothetical protein
MTAYLAKNSVHFCLQHALASSATTSTTTALDARVAVDSQIGRYSSD